jgi:hypothetical protein
MNSKNKAKLYRAKGNNVQLKLEETPNSLFEKNRFRAKPRSKSPDHSEIKVKEKPKRLRFETESENHVRFMVDDESETPLNHNYFESSSDDSEDNAEGENEDERWNIIRGTSDSFTRKLVDRTVQICKVLACTMFMLLWYPLRNLI